MGKTVICLTLLSRLLGRFAYNHCLVIAPLRVATQTWPTEVGMWEHTACISYMLIRAEDEESIAAINAAGKRAREASFYRGSKEDKRQLERDVARAKSEMKERILRRLATTPASLHIINREQVEWLVALFGNKWPFDVVIVDESSSFKDHTTKRFKALKSVKQYVKRMHLLTATPAAETYLHLFPQIYLLDGGERFGRMVTVFRERYFSYNQWKRKYKLRPGAEEEISEKIADICLVMKAEDYLDVAKPLFINRVSTLTPKQLDQYKSFERDFVMELDDGEFVEAETAAALSQKLMQLASGAVYGQEKKRHWIHDHKIEDLEQLIEELDGEPIMVSYWFQSSLERLKKRFPKAVVMDKEGKNLKPWNDRKIPILLVHPAGVAHGLNMQHGGHHLYIFDIFYSLELYLQLVGRLARQGQTKVVRVYHSVALGTIDLIAVSALVEKRDAQEDLFARLKRLRAKYLKAKLLRESKIADDCGL